MKKMKTRTKLAGAVTALVVAVALSAGTTFAWFTTSNLVSVNTISANVVSSSGGLEIATGLNASSGFSSTLSVTLTDYKKLDALTATISSNAVTLKNRTGTAGVSTADSSVSSSNYANYIEFSFTLRAKTQLYINLGKTSNVTSEVGSDPYDIKDWTSGEITADKYGNSVSAGSSVAAMAANASRVAFETTDSYTSGVASISPTACKIWSPHEADITGKHINAEESASNAPASTATAQPAGFWRGNLASDYEQYLVKNGYMSYAELNTATGGKYDSVTYTNAAYKQSNGSGGGYTLTTDIKTNQVITPISDNAPSESKAEQYSGLIQLGTAQSDGYCYANVTVKLWLEGTDGDCLNSIFSQVLKLDLELVGTTYGYS